MNDAFLKAIELAGTQAELARMVNVSNERISQCKKDANKVSPRLALRIQEALGKQVLAQDICPNFPWDQIVLRPE